MNTAWVASQEEEDCFLGQGCRVFLWENNLDNGTGATTEKQTSSTQYHQCARVWQCPHHKCGLAKEEWMLVVFAEGTFVAVKIDADGLATS